MSKQGVRNKGTLYMPLTSNGDWLERKAPEAPTRTFHCFVGNYR
jgi:hypothetical protein